jgi:hypothetical protein
VTAIDPPLLRAFRVEGWPFEAASTMAQPREADAIALEPRVWASACRPSVNVASLARRAVEVMAARRLRGGESDSRRDDAELLDTLLSRGRLGPEPEIARDHGQRWADPTTT